MRDAGLACDRFGSFASFRRAGRTVALTPNYVTPATRPWRIAANVAKLLQLLQRS